jgi:hypothetical protein
MKENQKAKMSAPGCGQGWGGIFTARPEAHLQHSRGLAAISRIVNDAIVEQPRKLTTMRNLRGAKKR